MTWIVGHLLRGAEALGLIASGCRTGRDNEVTPAGRWALRSALRSRALAPAL